MKFKLSNITKDEIAIISGTSNLKLAEEISQYLKIPLLNTLITTFSDGEIRVQLNETLRGKDVFIIQSYSKTINKSIMELLIIIDAVKRASAGRITAVLPYFPYARQDRKDRPRVPISSKLLANLLTTAGANRLLTIDLHAGQLQGFFDIPVDHLFAQKTLNNYFKNKKFQSDIVVVSPDIGGTERARAFAELMKAPIAIIDKRRENPNESEVMNIIGKIQNKSIIIVDDIIDTAGTLCKAAAALIEKGAKEVYATATHAVFSGEAINRINNSVLQEVVVTNTIALAPEAEKVSKIKVVSIAPLISEAIKIIHGSGSMNKLFEI
ncbi:MAG TPA: ribose-phosphate pyrophosphokinase [bacterium]|nr:ribose-phosphate pyrophosphokinase [bacterium]HOL46644.1 ribose-phosphate pyrophosphokinase [bacterium]HPQ17785.1 ribose-phosphate pyrophosphokinase [bacterium]